MSITCTFPGRYGDLLWALPTMRALAEASGDPVDLIISGKYGSIAPLIQTQPYIGSVQVLREWEVQETAPIQPNFPPLDLADGLRPVIHLGYPGWPDRPLPEYIWKIAKLQYPTIAPLDLDKPWITVPSSPGPPHRVLVVGFSDEWFELKYGIAYLLDSALGNDPQGNPQLTLWPSSYEGGRWHREGGLPPCSWVETSHVINASDVFLGCCSALHVLACALGKKIVLMEPNEHRWNDIFYPYGKTGRVTLVLGNDGRPTFDARHVRDAIQKALGE